MSLEPATNTPIRTRQQRMPRAAVIAAALVLWACAAHAGGTTEAAREFDRGTAAAARGDFLDAAAAFHRAYELAPHAAPLYNAALAWQAAGDRPRAADAYAKAISMGGLAEPQQRDAQRRLASLDAQLALLEVTGPQGTTVSVAHAKRAPIPAHIRLEPGDHELRAWFADGTSVLRQLSVRAGPTELVVEPAKHLQPAPPPEPPDQPVVRESSSLTRTIGWTSLGAGVAIGGVTAFLGVQALQARDQYYDSGRTDRDAYDRAGSYRTWTNVALGASVVAGAAGLVLLLKSPPAQQSHDAERVPSVRVSLRTAPGSLSLHASF